MQDRGAALLRRTSCARSCRSARHLTGHGQAGVVCRQSLALSRHVTEGGGVNPAHWKTVEDILASALELPPERQAAYVEQCCAGSPEIRKEVEELLTAYRAAEKCIEPRAGKFDLPEGFDDTLLGTRVGTYKLVERIGDGGMGTVYRAERDDQQFTQVVAVKLVRAGLHDPELLKRLRTERQILALLEHPHIARLLDGGITAGGQPYIVMEYIEGARITDDCKSQNLNIRQRLALFRQICSAVHYAHQRLVVHRDIKPSNILVARDGAPKLLDFGIAKIVDTTAGVEGHTLTNLNPMTPEYASPEQVQGKVLTTATDIYSLGVLLYELLTGQKPYKTAEKTPQEVARLVCESEPPKPSTAITALAKAQSQAGRLETISGDLDHIVLKAMRKEPAQRYASAEELSADIGNYLAGLPIQAREGSFRYLASKFVARHKTVVALSSALLLALITGLAVVSWEVHVAHVERARAERHFNEVRKLANSFLFEFHDSIKDLPGATPARKLVVSRALEYLDVLSKEAGSDTSLQRELAAAYEKVGDVQGNPYGANLGDTTGALASYRKELAIRESLLNADPGNTALKMELSGVYWKIGLCLDGVSDFPGSLTNLRKALTLTEQTWHAGDGRMSDHLAGDYWSIAGVLAETGDWAAALEQYRKAASIHEAAQGDDPKLNATLRTHLAGDYYGIAEVLGHQGQNGEAAEAARKSAVILQALSQADPANTTLRNYLAGSQRLLGGSLEEEGHFSESLESYRQAQKIYETDMAADPADAFSRRLVGFTQVRIGEVLVKEKKAMMALEELRKALRIFQELAKAAPSSNYVSHNFGNVYAGMGDAYAALAADSNVPVARQRQHWREACSWYRKSMDIRLNLQRQGELTSSDTEELNQVAKQVAKCGKTPSAGKLLSTQQ